MSNTISDRWIDFPVICEHINRVLSDVPSDVIGRMLFVSPETVRSWRYGKRIPDVPILIILSVLAKTDFLDFVGFKKDCFLADAEGHSDLEQPYAEVRKNRRKEWHFVTEREIRQSLLFDKAEAESMKIKTIIDFLLYLPLIPKEFLYDFLFRTIGKPDVPYIMQKLRDLDMLIPDSSAKAYAEKYHYYHMEYPTVQQIPLNTKLSAEQEKLGSYFEYLNSDLYIEELRKYRGAANTFRQEILCMQALVHERFKNTESEAEVR